MSARILIIDDIDANVRLLEAKMSAEYYEVLMASDGHSGIALAKAQLPDIILLDVMMPGLSGPETLDLLRQLPEMRGVPVVFLTAKAMPDELEQLLQHGATGLIVKPFDPMTLPTDILPFWEHGRG